VYENVIRKFTESCWIIREQSNRETERISNRGVIYTIYSLWNNTENTPWTSNILLKSEGEEGKTDTVQGE
jgi:hypothetical protein